MKDRKTVLLVISCTALLFLFFYLSNKITEMRHAWNSLSEFTANVQEKEEFYRLHFDLNNKMAGLIAPDVFCIKSSTEENLLSEMVKDQPLLIYRYTHKNCNTCYLEELKALQEDFPDYFDFISVLCSYQSDKELLIHKRTHKIELPLYNVPFDAFNWITEEHNSPYYFVLHPNMKISNIYVPNKAYPEMNKMYLEGIKRFLSD
jgi:hypothetical protein